MSSYVTDTQGLVKFMMGKPEAKRVHYRPAAAIVQIHLENVLALD
jgi:hypothetical protein